MTDRIRVAMSPAIIQSELARIGRRLSRWQAEMSGAIWAAVSIGVLFASAMADLLFSFNRAGRLIVWVLFVGVLIWGMIRVIRLLSERRSTQGVAVRVEAVFPQLDNRLINFVQFSGLESPDPLVQAYLQQGIPEWGQVDLADLKDKQRHRNAFVVFLVACVIFIVPFLWSSHAWTNALARIVNPVSMRHPSTLARIHEVDPGDSSMIAGSSLVLSCESGGKFGQEVVLELWPDDDEKVLHRLGSLSGADRESFAFEVRKPTADFRYRFLSGDARSEKYTVRRLAKLAPSRLDITLDPPDYTGMASSTIDALSTIALVPESSRGAIHVEFNRDVSEVRIEADGAHIPAAGSAGQGRKHSFTDLVFASERLVLIAASPLGDEFRAHVQYQMLPDRKPAIRILDPQGRAVLGPGAVPSIRFEVMDDYGIAEVQLEIVPNTDESGSAESVATWPIESDRRIEKNWSAENGLGKDQSRISYRIVALDSASSPNRTESPLIEFHRISGEKVWDAGLDADEKARASLSRLVGMQRDNLERTRRLHDSLTATTPSQWKETAETQRSVREIAGELLKHPARPLGNLHAQVATLWKSPMRDVIDVLRRIPDAAADRKPQLAQRGVTLEEGILRTLTRIDENVEKAQLRERISDLISQLDQLAKAQKEIATSTRTLDEAGGNGGQHLAGKQDVLADDTFDFLQACSKEVEVLRVNDEAFALLVAQTAALGRQGMVAENMIQAAEQLDTGALSLALPFEIDALATLIAMQELLRQWQIEGAREETADSLDALRDTKRRLEKLKKLQTKVVEAIRETQRQEDLSDQEYDAIEEELEFVRNNIKEALLKIATDLHIFPDIPVGNELVDDIYQVYEEAEQVAGSEEEAADELGLQKEDFILEALEKATERLDGMEMWLQTAPDNVRRLTENFDENELPEIALIPLSTELEDIIGDLLDQQEDIEEESHDSATNQGSADMEEGWGIEEGEYVNYSAKGKSGNMRPDHNEQSGRSLVGRQGQSDGETVAGSGNIEEGDENIEARKTEDGAQSGQVHTDEHRDAKATGGGKMSGFDDEYGMQGAGPRRDSHAPSSPLGIQAMLRRNAEQIYAKASMMHMRTGRLDEAILNMRKAEDAIEKGYPIRQVREYQRRAAVALRRTQADLSGRTLDVSGKGAAVKQNDDSFYAGAAEEAPAEYRDLVAEYFRALSESEEE